MILLTLKNGLIKNNFISGAKRSVFMSPALHHIAIYYHLRNSGNLVYELNDTEDTKEHTGSGGFSQLSVIRIAAVNAHKLL